jgi:hypothetical protein
VCQRPQSLPAGAFAHDLTDAVRDTITRDVEDCPSWCSHDSSVMKMLSDPLDGFKLELRKLCLPAVLQDVRSIAPASVTVEVCGHTFVLCVRLTVPYSECD